MEFNNKWQTSDSASVMEINNKGKEQTSNSGPVMEINNKDKGQTSNSVLVMEFHNKGQTSKYGPVMGFHNIGFHYKGQTSKYGHVIEFNNEGQASNSGRVKEFNNKEQTSNSGPVMKFNKKGQTSNSGRVREFNKKGKTSDSEMAEAAMLLLDISKRKGDLTVLFEKQLTETDAKLQQCKLSLPKASVENYIIPHLTPEQMTAIMNESRLKLSLHDLEHGMDHKFVLRCGESYGLTTGWIDYLKQRGLRRNDVVKFWWDGISHRFCITSRHHSDILKVVATAG
jgi:hypothetical protein